MTFIRLERDGPVATICLARPEARNALSLELCDEIVTTLGAVNDARVVVIKGEGSVFCSGADLNDVSGPRAAQFVEHFEGMLTAVERCEAPTVAAIHGAALGGGLQLASACDFRIAAHDATLGIPSARLGVIVTFESVRRLALLVGIGRTKEILMTARSVTGAEAVELGLVTASHPPDRLAAEVDEFAAHVASLAPLSVRGAKVALRAFADAAADVRSQRPEAAAAIDELVKQAYASDDLAEGVEAARSRAVPRFLGR